MIGRRSRAPRRRGRGTGASSNPYVLVSRTPDGRLRAEGFRDAVEYRRRLLVLPRDGGCASGGDAAVSVDELLDLLDV